MHEAIDISPEFPGDCHTSMSVRYRAVVTEQCRFSGSDAMDKANALIASCCAGGLHISERIYFVKRAGGINVSLDRQLQLCNDEVPSK